MITYYLQPAQFHQLQALARDWLGDQYEDDLGLDGLGDDLRDAAGNPASIDDDSLMGVMDVTDWHVRIESMDADFQVQPFPAPGSWYDPAIDPSNAPAAAGLPLAGAFSPRADLGDATVVTLDPLQVLLLRTVLNGFRTSGGVMVRSQPWAADILAQLAPAVSPR